MRMIRSVASWGLELRWCGQREWPQMIEKLQYAVLRRFTWAVVRARKELVRKIAAVESVEMFVCASAGRFLARSMCDPSWVGVVEDGAIALEGMGGLSLRGLCWRGEIVVAHWGVDLGGTKKEWE